MIFFGGSDLRAINDRADNEGPRAWGGEINLIAAARLRVL